MEKIRIGMLSWEISCAFHRKDGISERTGLTGGSCSQSLKEKECPVCVKR